MKGESENEGPFCSSPSNQQRKMNVTTTTKIFVYQFEGEYYAMFSLPDLSIKAINALNTLDNCEISK